MASRRKYKEDEALLIEDLKKMENEAIRFLYDEYYPMVRELSIKYNLTEDDAYDIMQETVLAIFRQFNQNNNHLTTSFKAYFFGIARNLMIANLRILARDHGESVSDDQEEKAIKDKGALEELLNGSTYHETLLQIIDRCLLQLDPNDQKILNLFSEGYSYKEIAKSMKIKSESLARHRKYTAKKRLFDLIISDSEYRELKGIK